MENRINHIVFVIDASGSMQPVDTDVVKVFDGQIAHLAQRSKEVDQETRVSVYLFNSVVQCLIYDMDVLRLPSLAKMYKASGNTALIDGTMKAIEDLKLTPEIYADHAFLVYVLTDGEENCSRKYKPANLKSTIDTLKDNWTVACLVPNALGEAEAKRFGFPAKNVQVWSTSTAGVQEVGEVIRRATDNFMTARSQGMRSTRNLFSLDASNLNTTQVKRSLDQLSAAEYEILHVRRDEVIKPFVESWTKKPYVQGSAYYQLTKPETIQGSKQICIQEVKTGKIFSGNNARKMLGLPNYEVKVKPGQMANFDVYVQSTSVNRKLVPGTKVIVLK